MTLSTGKLIATATGVTGVTGIAATSAVLAGGSGDSTTNSSLENQEPTQLQQTPVKKIFQKPTWQPSSIPTLNNAGDIQNHYEKLPCIKDALKEISNWPGTNESSNLSDVRNIPNTTDTKSCLVVENYKQTYTDNKWWGEFRLAWSIKNENLGQVFLAAIDAKTKNGKLWGSSAAYILKKESGENKWKALYSKENKEQEIHENVDLEKIIPQTGHVFRANKDISDIRWDFDPNLFSICEDGYCSEVNGSAEHKTFVWEFTGGGSGGGLDDWCNNLSSWLNNNFSLGSVLGKLSTVRGTWKKQNT